VARLHIVVFQEGDWLCGQCVDFDLAAQARTLPALYRAIDKLIRGHIAVRRRHGLPAFKDLPAAPPKFREMFDRSKINLPHQIIPQDVSLPTSEVRVAVIAAA
jgi:hypothetical protein